MAVRLGLGLSRGIPRIVGTILVPANPHPVLIPQTPAVTAVVPAAQKQPSAPVMSAISVRASGSSRT